MPKPQGYEILTRLKKAQQERKYCAGTEEFPGLWKLLLPCKMEKKRKKGSQKNAILGKGEVFQGANKVLNKAPPPPTLGHGQTPKDKEKLIKNPHTLPPTWDLSSAIGFGLPKHQEHH